MTFTSSSTVRFLMEAAGAFPAGARLVSIGPVTSATAREHGLEVHVEAERHDIDGLVDALVEDADLPAGQMIVSLVTDYGTEDDFVGICHGVIASIAPDARIIDVTHGVPRFDVRRGAIVLHDALPYLPVGVHMAVVDPQVGTERRGIAVQCHDGRVLVGPDNGLLSLAWRTAGGVDTAVDITLSPHRLEPVSATFHGRDVFAPVAAHIAAGEPVEDAGTPLEPDALQEVEPLWPEQEGDTLVTRVLYVDGFGNATLNAGHSHIVEQRADPGRQRRGRRRPRARARATFTSTFADVRGGRADRLRGRPPAPGAGGQPRHRRRPAEPGARHRGPAAAHMIGAPRVHHRETGSTNVLARELAAARRAARDAGDRRPPDRGPRPLGPDVAGAARVVGADVAGRAARRSAAAAAGGGGRGRRAAGLPRRPSSGRTTC